MSLNRRGIEPPHGRFKCAEIGTKERLLSLMAEWRISKKSESQREYEVSKSAACVSWNEGWVERLGDVAPEAHGAMGFATIAKPLLPRKQMN